MNPDLELKISDFKAGLEIQFPAYETLEGNTHVIDAEVAKYFYEINDYYSAFQNKFNEEYTKILESGQQSEKVKEAYELLKKLED